VNVVDSSGWLEFLTDGANARFFSKPIQEPRDLLVPSITILEVFKKILQERTEKAALDIIGHMFQGQVINLDAELALSAAKLGRELGLHLADSVILATARLHSAILWTQDKDFKSIQGVKYISKH